MKNTYVLSVYSYPTKLSEAEANHEEFIRLVKSAGGKIVGDEIYQLRNLNPNTGIGIGKVAELKDMFKQFPGGVRLIALDAGLRAYQIKHLEDAFNIEVSDRTRIILEIFKRRAVSAEGKLQVELAEAQYEIGRLVGGRGSQMSKQGGGVGAKGPGETFMEKERRTFKKRIKMLKDKLDHVKKTRDQQRKQRVRDGYFTISLVGYTNAGKSTLLNALTKSSEVISKNELFTTVDPTTRVVCLEAPLATDRAERLQQTAMVTDTVGFISRLPHELVEGFESTLEQVDLSDVVLAVLDISDPRHEEKEAVVMETLQKIHNTAPVLKIYNKFDLLSETRKMDPAAVYISAATGEGLEELKARLYELSGKKKLLPSL